MLQSEAIFLLLQKGLAYKANRLFNEAINCFKKIIFLEPKHLDAINNLGATYKDLGEKDKASKYFFDVLTLQPDYPIAHANLALVFLNAKEYKTAYFHFQKAFQSFQNNADFLFHYGLTLEKLNFLKEAAVEYERAVRIDPNYYAAMNNLSIIKILMGELTEAEKILLSGIKRFPGKEKLLTNIGLCYEEKGEIHKAIHYYKKAATMEKNGTQARSNLLFAMHYLENINMKKLYDVHSRWCTYPNQIMLKRDSNKHHNIQQIINIGYISPDLRTHPVASFLYPILLNHNKYQVNIFCYSNSENFDMMSEKLKKLSTKWVDISSLTDQDVCHEIQKDNIHILVDLAGHSKRNRLGVLAMKPAPVQLSYLGYPGTTGIEQIDYRLTDQWADPEDFEPFYHEKIVRMPDSFLCFDPEYKFPEIHSLPALKNKYITLGSFNRMSKLNPFILERWATILKHLPDSRLLLKAQAFHDSGIVKKIQIFFEQMGVNKKRLILYERTASRTDHLKMYHNIDIALDTFPYHGTTTTCQALWMGVPVITLIGNAHVSRVSMSILKTMGLTEFIATTSDEYVNKVIHLSNNLHLLSQLRKNLRAIGMNSPLHQSKTFVKHLERIYKMMWEHHIN